MTYLYILTDPEKIKDNQYKVGFTTCDTKGITQQYRRQLPCVKLLFHERFENAKELENMVKTKFKSSRISNSNNNLSEWFRHDINEIISFININGITPAQMTKHQKLVIQLDITQKELLRIRKGLADLLTGDSSYDHQISTSSTSHLDTITNENPVSVIPTFNNVTLNNLTPNIVSTHCIPTSNTISCPIVPTSNNVTQNTVPTPLTPISDTIISSVIPLSNNVIQNTVPMTPRTLTLNITSNTNNIAPITVDAFAITNL